jgi:hypothetical protein
LHRLTKILKICVFGRILRPLIFSPLQNGALAQQTAGKSRVLRGPSPAVLVCSRALRCAGASVPAEINKCISALLANASVRAPLAASLDGAVPCRRLPAPAPPQPPPLPPSGARPRVIVCARAHRAVDGAQCKTQRGGAGAWDTEQAPGRFAGGGGGLPSCFRARRAKARCAAAGTSTIFGRRCAIPQTRGISGPPHSSLRLLLLAPKFTPGGPSTHSSVRVVCKNA